MTTASERAPCKTTAWSAVGASAALIISLSALPALAGTPQIRTSASNTVPQCVTPQRLMAFLKSRNPHIEPRFSQIANLYKRYGEAWHVRWDYAFFQMAVETNFLSFKRGDGSWGDVKPRQNNFAGLGTTGGGVPGDSFPDVGTGVLAQIQHLVVYSGEHVANPVGPRTQLKQDDILESMAHLKGHTTFADLSRRWAADRHYGATIEWVAGKYRAAYCSRTQERTAAAPAKTTIRIAKTEQLPPAAALGGPQAKLSQKDAPPVRTIWSRSATTQPAVTGATDATPAPQPARPTVEIPAVPERAPVPAPVVNEGNNPSQAAAANAPTSVPTPVEVTPAPRFVPPQPALQPASDEQPHAFAFAAAMVATAAAAPVPHTTRCRVFSASYGGTKTLLIKDETAGELHYTTLTVIDGSEDSMLANYLKAHAPGGSSLGTFATRDAALMKAGELCPASAGAPREKSASAG